jgi:hypothetical protein
MMNTQISKRFLHFLAFCSVLLVLSGCFGAKPSGYRDEPIDATQDPAQSAVYNLPPFPLTVSGGQFFAEPAASYRIAARLVSKERYSTGWAGAIAPFDYALAWGRLSDPASDAYVSYRQNQRWYYYRYKQNSPFDAVYISAHSSNHHILPATSNLRAALKQARKGDLMELEGYLVNLRGLYNGRLYTWRTSLSRADTGGGSCELFYLTRLRIGRVVYE